MSVLVRVKEDDDEQEMLVGEEEQEEVEERKERRRKVALSVRWVLSRVRHISPVSLSRSSTNLVCTCDF